MIMNLVDGSIVVLLLIEMQHGTSILYLHLFFTMVFRSIVFFV
jgi:hypothetical protein